MNYQSERSFHLWDFHVTHNLLLLRSPISSTVDENLDLIFWGVDYINIPAILNGLSVSEATDAERAGLGSLGPAADVSSTTFALETSFGRFYIVASGYQVYKNTLEHLDSGLAYFAEGTGKYRRIVGEALARS